MGYLDGESCYASRADALAAFAARNSGSVVQVDGLAYILTVSPLPAGVQYTFRPAGSGRLFYRVVQLDLRSCDLLEWPDYIVLSWAVVGVWVAVYALRVLRRGLYV